MTFKEFVTDINKMTGTVVGLAAMVGVMWAMYSHFYTDLEAAEHIEEFRDYQQQQYMADKFEREDRVQEQIDEIDFTLLEEDLPERKREYLKHKREELVDKMKCIREETC